MPSRLSDDGVMHHHLIVGDDGSRVAAAAVDWAADEAVRRDAGLTIVGCFTLPLFTDYGLAPPPSAAEVDSVRAETQQRLDDAARRVAATRPGLAANACAVGGRARRELVEQAEQADLLVVGSSGTGDSPTYLIGSVAHALMRNSPCPVVLVPGVRPLPERPRLTVAVDGTSRCDAALDWAADEADLLQGRLTVVHVWAYPYAASVEPSEARDLTRVDAALHLEQAVAKVRARTGADVEGILVEGDGPAEVAASAFSADLVVLGTHRRRTFGLVPIGSVADGVIARATCPVVTVSQPATD